MIVKCFKTFLFFEAEAAMLQGKIEYSRA